MVQCSSFYQSPASIVKAVLKTEPNIEPPSASSVEPPLQPRSLQQPTVIAAEQAEHHQRPQQQHLIQVSILASGADSNCVIEGAVVRGSLLHQRQSHYSFLSRLLDNNFE